MFTLVVIAACSTSKPDANADKANKVATEAAEQPAEVAEVPKTDQASGTQPDQAYSLKIETDAGLVEVVPVYHGTLYFQLGDTVVWVDPWSKASFEDTPKADFVLLTDIHQDHLDEEALSKVTAAETKLVGPKAVADKLTSRKVDHVVANGETVEIGTMKVTGVPMYNNTRGPEEGGLFHDKGRGNGYLVEVGGKRLYIAGDTACTEEMKAMQNIDHAFVPMNLPYTMPPIEAAECVKAFKPKKVTPYHYAGSELDEFEAALKDVEGVEVVRVDFYPGGLPW